MMTDWHDSATKLFKETPRLAADVLRDCMDVPLKIGVKPVPLSQVISDKPSRDLIPDMAFLVGPTEKPTRCIIVEIQTKMTDEKRRQWPRYLTALWTMWECPVDLLVICPNEAAARSCAALIHTNLEHFVCPPKVLFPSQIPALTSPEEVAVHPGLGVLSVAYHGADPRVTEAFVAGTAFIRDEKGNIYYDWGYNMTTPVVQQMMEDLMTTTYRMPHSPTLRKEHEAGIAEGEAKAQIKDGRETVLMVLRARRIEPTDEQRRLVETCEDVATLKQWANRGLDATGADDVFK